MHKIDLGYRHIVKFETITPVSIGDGECLSPLTDITLKPANKLHLLYLNHKIFESWLEQNPEILFDFLSEVKLEANYSKNSFLYNFISRYHPDADSFFYKAIPISGESNIKVLKTCMKFNGKPYLPGSTLKGAFKSVWLHNWLSDNSIKVEKIVEIIKQNNDNNQLADKINHVVDECLGRINQKENEANFSLLRVGDGFCSENLTCYHTERFSLLSPRECNVPLFIEAISPHSCGTFEILIEDHKKVKISPEPLEKLKEATLTSFFKDINHYSLDHIEYELSTLQSEELLSYKRFLSDLKSEIKYSQNRSAWLPIGFGKSNLYQSIGLQIYRHDKVAFAKYAKLLGLKKKKEDMSGNEKFPLTRNLTLDGYLALGWVRLYENEAVAEIATNITHEAYIDAIIETINKPFPKVKIPGKDELYNMLGTKEAQKNLKFKIGAVAVVQVDADKEGKIRQVRYICMK